MLSDLVKCLHLLGCIRKLYLISFILSLNHLIDSNQVWQLCYKPWLVDEWALSNDLTLLCTRLDFPTWTLQTWMTVFAYSGINVRHIRRNDIKFDLIFLKPDSMFLCASPCIVKNVFNRLNRPWTCLIFKGHVLVDSAWLFLVNHQEFKKFTFEMYWHSVSLFIFWWNLLHCSQRLCGGICKQSCKQIF